MRKVRLDIPLLLPQVSDVRDQCIRRMVGSLVDKAGIDEAHVVAGDPAQLCIHYHPSQVSLNEVKDIAKQNGAILTHRYQHRNLRVRGIRQPRHARRISEQLTKIDGIVAAEASAAGTLRLEWDKERIAQTDVLNAVQQTGIKIRSGEVAAARPPIVTERPGAVIVDTPAPAADPHAGHDHAPGAHAHGHAHDHDGVFGEYTELIFAIISGVLWLAAFVLGFIDAVPESWSIGLSIGAMFFGGYYTVIEAYEALSKGIFEIDFLMLVAAAGAAALGKWEEGALLLFLFSLGHALEHYAMARARKSIAALSELAPATALVKRGGTTEEVPIDTLAVGDVIVVKPNTKIAADGVVVSGESTVNQAAITGESVPVDKLPVADPAAAHELEKLPAEHRTFAGTINGSQVLEVRVLRIAADSTLSRLITLVREAETQKSPTQQFADKIERFYVPAVLIMVGLLHFAFLVLDETFGESFYRAMAVLVAASPCALAISTPSAILAGIGRAAQMGVLIKGGRPLEDLGTLTAVAFDKTGTLTEGKPQLTEVLPAADITETELLQTLIAVESLSDHPLAAGIVAGGKLRLGNAVLPQAENMEALTARGVRATIAGEAVHVGNRRLMAEVTGTTVPTDLDAQMDALEKRGQTAMLIHRADRYLGLVAVMDVARPAARDTLQKLKKIGIRRMIMLTGDHQQVADAVAADIGITDPLGSLLPEDKVAAVERLLREEGKVAMIGDGVNDAPAMAKSTVGIAMGAAGSDVALETADIALMSDRLDRLPFAIGLSRKASRIIKQNLWISMGMVAILVPLTLFGIADIGPAVVGHEGSTLLVVANALRLLGYGRGS